MAKFIIIIGLLAIGKCVFINSFPINMNVDSINMEGSYKLDNIDDIDDDDISTTENILKYQKINNEFIQNQNTINQQNIEKQEQNKNQNKNNIVDIGPTEKIYLEQKAQLAMMMTNVKWLISLLAFIIISSIFYCYQIIKDGSNSHTKLFLRILLLQICYIGLVSIFCFI